MNQWRSGIDLEARYWADYCQLLNRIACEDFPTASDLNHLKPEALLNCQGLPISFVDSRSVSGTSYEEHIFNNGEVSTRERNWHDLFNALVWMHYPALKASMNELHHRAMQEQTPGRGKQRDALTLFDECGVIIVSHETRFLDAVSNRNWKDTFDGGSDRWRSHYRVFVTGHAMLEKFLQPYKAMTANALLVRITKQEFKLERDPLRAKLDACLAQQILSGRMCRTSNDLSPIPLMGIPGWWQESDLDDAFYADEKVFRPAPQGYQAAPVFSIKL
jgi:hypothetical protein